MRFGAKRNWYGITCYKPSDYRIDHLIPHSLGGSNSLLYLWPPAHATSPRDPRAKEALGKRLLKLVCSGQVDLHTAQREIAADWTSAYQV
jgi:hypothetical protein